MVTSTKKLTAAQAAAWKKRLDLGPDRPLAARDFPMGEQNVDLRAPLAVRPGVSSGYPANGGTPAAVAAAKAAAAAAAAKPTSPTQTVTSQAPVAAKAGEAADQAGLQQADLISKYNLARAEILKGLAPQVQGIYNDSNERLQGLVGDSTLSARNSLFGMGGNGNTSTTARGNDFVENNQGALDRIQGSYNADAVANAAKYLGGTLPGTQLLDRGKEFGMAAAFAPGAALQEGAYAIHAALEKGKVTNADAAKVSAGTSKLLGYVADAYGNPIPGKDGKPIKITDPKATLTPYQKAQIKLSEGRLTQSKASAAATDARYYAGMTFKTAQQAKTAAQKENSIDWQTTKNLNDGMIHLKGGGILTDSHRRVVSWKPTQAATKPGKASNQDYNKAVGEAKKLVGGPSVNPNFGKEITWGGPKGTYVDDKGNRYLVQQGKYLANPKYKTKVFGNGTGKPLTTNNPKYAIHEQKMTFQEGMSFLMERYSLTKKQARAAMIAAGGKP